MMQACSCVKRFAGTGYVAAFALHQRRALTPTELPSALAFAILGGARPSPCRACSLLACLSCPLLACSLPVPVCRYRTVMRARACHANPGPDPVFRLARARARASLSSALPAPRRLCTVTRQYGPVRSVPPLLSSPSFFSSFNFFT